MNRVLVNVNFYLYLLVYYLVCLEFRLKKTVLNVALLALLFPITFNAIGLGEMTVKSSLDQPFLAEIELLDVGRAPIVGIKVGVAEPDNFQQLGLERVAVLSLLHFKIEKNSKGKFVIKVQSQERISEPYIELVVDLTWPGGQLYKAYTVLLDPPGYKLVSTRAQSSPTYYKKVASHGAEPGVIEKTVTTEVQHNPVSLNDGKKQTTYGPTIANENVWQIAQRYKTSEIILPQIVLAITGANPDAFTGGNLNGLKVGVRLTIPATSEIAKIPAELATAEVMAHDKAWNEKTPINHVLTPPYTNGQATNPLPQTQKGPQSKSSEIPTIPRFTIQAITPDQNTMPQLIPSAVGSPGNTNQSQPVQNNDAQNADQNAIIKTELSITTAVVETVRESNALLMEQLHLLQDQNKKLQKQLEQRDKEMKTIRAQMQALMKQRIAVAGQVNSAITDNQSSNFWTLLLLLIVASGGGGFAYWYFKLREKETNEQPFLSNEPIAPKTTMSETTQTSVQPAEISIREAGASPTIETNEVDSKTIAEHSAQNKRDDFVSETEKKPELVDNEVMVQSEKERVASKTELTTEPELSLENKEAVDLQSAERETNLSIDKTAKELKDESSLEFGSVINQNDQDVNQTQPSTEESSLMIGVNKPQLSQQNESTSQKEEPSTPDVLEFESGLYQRLTEQTEQKTKKVEETEEQDRGIDFVSSSSIESYKIEKNQQSDSQLSVESDNKNEGADDLTLDSKLEDFSHTVVKEDTVTAQKDMDLDAELAQFFADSDKKNIVSEDNDSHIETKEISETDDSQTANPLKSKTAFDTLLALANTYISMDDIESAKASLEEILEHGSEQQKAEAQRLLDQIKDK